MPPKKKRRHVQRKYGRSEAAMRKGQTIKAICREIAKPKRKS